MSRIFDAADELASHLDLDPKRLGINLEVQRISLDLPTIEHLLQLLHLSAGVTEGNTE